METLPSETALYRLRRPLVLGGLFAVLYLPQLGYLAGDVWLDPKYSHGFLIPLVSAWYIYLHKDRIASVAKNPSWIGLVFLVLGVYLWFHSQAQGFNALAHFSMIVVIVGMMLFAAGFRYLAAVAFPVFYLALAFPVPKQLDKLYVVLPLQRLASKISAAVLDVAGVPVFRQGNVIDVPGMQLLVEEACSGIHSLNALVALGTAYVFLTERRWWERVVLIVGTVPIAIFANVFRVTVTGLLATLVSPELAKGFFHTFGGLLVFVLGFLLLLLFNAMLRSVFPPRVASV